VGKKLRIVLVHVTPISQFPLGIGMIAAVFENEGCEVFPIVNNFNNYQEVEALANTITAIKPDMVGLSFQTFGVKINYSLVSLLKKEKLFVVGGGNHLTLFPEEGIENGFDVAIIGEGEETSKHLVEYLNNPNDNVLSQIKGIVFRNDEGDIVRTGAPSILQDLDILPFPARHLFDRDSFVQHDGELKGYGKIFTGRGCPHQCTFCCPSVFGRKFRHRSAENVVDEIEKVKKEFNVSIFTFIDDTLLVNTTHLKEICGEILKRQLRIKWNCSARINKITPELLELMKKSGCFMMNFGIESGDPYTLKRIKKGIDIDRAVQSIKMTNKAGIKVYANFMTGFPWETSEQIQNTIDAVHKISPWVDQFSNKGVLIPEPGTEIYEDLKNEYNLEKYWLRDNYQNAGASIFQNVANPYKVSNWFQRNMYDDTYVRRELFFKYSSDQKRTIYRLAKAIGSYNFNKQFGKSWKARLYIFFGYCSFVLAEILPSFEIFVVSLFKSSGSKIHSNFGVGYSKKVGEKVCN